LTQLSGVVAPSITLVDHPSSSSFPYPSFSIPPFPTHLLPVHLFIILLPHRLLASALLKDLTTQPHYFLFKNQQSPTTLLIKEFKTIVEESSLNWNLFKQKASTKQKPFFDRKNGSESDG